MTEDEMVGWHHRLNGHEFEQNLKDSDGQRGLVCWFQYSYLGNPIDRGAWQAT